MAEGQGGDLRVPDQEGQVDLVTSLVLCEEIGSSNPFLQAWKLSAARLTDFSKVNNLQVLEL